MSNPARADYLLEDSGTQRWYPVVIATFCGLLLISNIAAIKLIAIGPLIFDGGALVFPLTYILGDVIAEIYGLKRARTAIITGFVLAAVMALVLWAVTELPPAQDWTLQAEWVGVLGFVWRITVASLLGYLAGQLLNAYVLVKLRERFAGRGLIGRLLASSLVGVSVDTIVFCTIAFGGTIPLDAQLSYTVTGIAYKLGVEVLLLPVTYLVIKQLRRTSQLASSS